MKSRGAPRCAARHEPHGSHRTASERRAGAVRNRSERFGFGSGWARMRSSAPRPRVLCPGAAVRSGTAAKPAGAERRFGSEPNANRSEPPLPRPAPQGRTRHGCGIWVGPVPVRRRPPAGGAGPGLQCGAVRGGRRGSVRHRDSAARNGAARPGSARLCSVRFGTGTTRLGTGGTAPHRSAWIASARLGANGTATLGSVQLCSARLRSVRHVDSAARHRSVWIGSAWFNSARLGSVQGQRGSERGCTASQPGSVRLASARFGTGTTRLGRAARLRTARPGSRRPRLGSVLDAPARPHSARLGSTRVSTARPGERGGWDLGLWGFRGGFGGMGRECRDYGGGWGYGVKWKWEMCRNRRKKG